MAAPVPNESNIPVGTVLVGKYRVTKEIGRGGMAAVYEAEHLTLGKKVAVKVLASELANSTVVIERFFREARAAASVRSPHIVDVYDSSRLEDGRPFIAMELLEGESLYDRMARVRIIDPRSTIRIITQCCKALAKAHSANIVHRDLKPENIFLMRGEDGEEVVKLLDFGLAKFYAPVEGDQKTARLTREGAVFGTPAYMSPEQVKGQGNVDHRADLWALGCMTYECLIGRPVWNTDQGVAMTFAAIAAATPPVPSKMRPDLPVAFDQWFKKALERDPAKRFQSAKEMAEELARAFSATSHVSLPGFSGETPEFSPDQIISVQDAPQLGRSSNGGPRMPPPVPSSRDGAALAAPTPPPQPIQPPSVMPPGLRSPGAGRVFLAFALLGATATGAWLTWVRVLRPQVSIPVVEGTAEAPSASASSAPDAAGVVAIPAAATPRWAVLMAEGQKLYTEGDVEGALRKWKESQDEGGGLAARSLTEHVKATQPTKDPCRLASISHPRIGLSGSAERPSVVATAKGAVVTWADDHEQSGHDHAYTVLLDPSGHPTTRARDVTPEANNAARPTTLAVGERIVLLFWDRGGREPGVRVRWLDDEGVISSASKLVSSARTGNFWPVIEKAPEGFFVAWQDDRDKEGDDIFLRRLGSGLEPVGNEMRLTDYVPMQKQPVHARVPSMVVASNTLYVVYRLERDKARSILRLALPLSLPELSGVGLEDKALNVAQKDRRERTLRPAVVVNEDGAPADAPDIACGKDGCFVVWHGEKGGAYGALIEPLGGTVLWRKRFAPNGSRPAVASGSDGTVSVAYYEGGRLKLAGLSRQGVGIASVLGRVSGDQPRPVISTGLTKGEWYVAWQSQEANRTEAFVARAVCRP